MLAVFGSLGLSACCDRGRMAAIVASMATSSDAGRCLPIDPVGVIGASLRPLVAVSVLNLRERLLTARVLLTQTSFFIQLLILDLCRRSMGRWPFCLQFLFLSALTRKQSTSSVWRGPVWSNPRTPLISSRALSHSIRRLLVARHTDGASPSLHGLH